MPGEEHSPRHVYLSGPSVALRPVLAGVAGSTRGVALTHVLPRMLFPHDPVARTPVLVARIQSQCFVDAGADDGAVALCAACPTCAAGLTVNGLFVVADAPEAHASVPWALALRRLAPGEPGSGQQSPAQGWDELLLMPHFLSAAGPGPWLVLPGMRPGALLLVTHAVRTARGCLGATARTNLRVVRFSPALCARPVRLGLGDWATRLQCASLGAALNITRGCLALARKVVTGVEALTPELVESVQCAAAEAAAGPAAVEQLKQARKHLAHARGSIYEELLHPFGAQRRLQDADHQAQGRFGDVPLRYRLPAVAELRASMARQWRQRRMAAPHDCCAGWPGDALDGARLGRLVLPLHHVLPASDGDDDDEPAPVVLVARLQQLPDSEDGAPRAGWHLYDATGHLDVALEDGATASHVASSVRTWTWKAQPGERYAVARCFFVAEAPLTGDLAAEPYIYLLCAPADLVHVSRASQGSHCSAVTRIAAPSSVATVRQLLTKSRLPSGVRSRRHHTLIASLTVVRSSRCVCALGRHPGSGGRRARSLVTRCGAGCAAEAARAGRGRPRLCRYVPGQMRRTAPTWCARSRVRACPLPIEFSTRPVHQASPGAQWCSSTAPTRGSVPPGWCTWPPCRRGRGSSCCAGPGLHPTALWTRRPLPQRV